MLEKDIESAVCSYATQTYDMLARKYTSPSHRSVPDRLFLGHGDHHFFIEFKKEGGKLTPGQEREIEKLKKRGHRVYVVDDIEEGKRIVDTEVQANRTLAAYIVDYFHITDPNTGAPEVIAPSVPDQGD